MANLIGKKAPSFSAKAVINGTEIISNFSLDQYIGKKNVVFFFYPKDFTFVCPTELHAFQEKLEEFEKRDTVVVACSTDSEQSHFGWLNTPKNHGGIQGVKYPIVADTNKTISMNYDVINGEYQYDDNGNVTASSELIAFRALFLIDKEGVVQHMLVNNLSLGRNVDEALRMVDSLNFYNENGITCPANWTSEKSGLVATHEGIKEYLTKN